MSFRSEEERRRRNRGDESGAQPSSDPEPRRARGRKRPWLLLLVTLLLLTLLVGAALLLWRSFGDNISGTSVVRDSIDAGPKPRVRLTNGAGQIRVEGVEDLGSVEYEATRHAVASDPAAAKERASQVSVDISREDSIFVLETGGGRNTGADYVLRIPSGGSVEVEAEAGDVEVTGISGDVTVRAAAGDVSVRDSGGSVTVEAEAGDVEIVDMSTDTGSAELEIGSGDATLQDMVVGTLEAAVRAGSVTFSGRFSGGGRVFVETGDIVVELPPEDTRDLTLDAQIGEVMRESGPDDGSGQGGGE